MKYRPWILLACALGLIIWLALALVDTENERHALMQGLCVHQVQQGAIAQKGEIDAHCLASVQSRANWWRHLQYGLTHLHR